MTDQLDVRAFAAQFQAFMSAMSEQLPTREPSPLLKRLTDHLGVAPQGLPMVVESYSAYEHPNIQAAIDSFIAGPGVVAELVGVIGPNREHEGFTDIITSTTWHRQDKNWKNKKRQVATT